jgi:hypothetical protein
VADSRQNCVQGKRLHPVVRDQVMGVFISLYIDRYENPHHLAIQLVHQGSKFSAVETESRMSLVLVFDDVGDSNNNDNFQQNTSYCFL